jgi:site-specific recombinase XerD
LDIFAMFLEVNEKGFYDIDKLLIDEYKGYLRTGQHLLDLDKIVQKKIKKVREELDMDEKKLVPVVYTESSSKGSKNGRSKSSGLNSRSVNRMLSSLRAFLSFLVDLDQKIPIPPNAIKFIKTEKKEKQIADFDELVQLIEAPDNFETKPKVKYRNRAILEILFSTGMRISELVGLNRNSVKLTRDGKTVSDPKLYIVGKGKKQRFVYLTQRAITFLERYLKTRNDEYDALFIPYRGQRKGSNDPDTVRISSRYVQSIITRYRELVGIVVPTSPHSLRHGFATYLAEQGANPAAIQKLLGHESLQTTTRYVHASDRFAEKSHKEFHPLQ